MLKTAILTAAAAAALVPAAASAQAVPGAVVAIVDLDRVSSQCTACKVAQTALQSQLTSSRTRLQTLATSVQTEGQSLQTAVNALPKGQEPNAALQTRIRAFQTKQQQFADERQNLEAQFQRNQAYVAQQIQSKLPPIYQQVMQRRGANVLVDQNTTLASASALDVTNDVLTALNAVLPSVATTAPAAPAQSQPQGR